jgi:hypothetical protein
MARRSLSFLLMVFAAVVTTAADVETVARVFRLDYLSISEASAAVQPMLSESGSLTLHPSRSRITVQDLPEVVDRVAELIADLDRLPGRFRIKIDLLEGRPETDNAGEFVVPYSSADQIQTDQRLKSMFKFPVIRRLGSAILEGELGSSATAEIGRGFEISFIAQTPEFSEDTPWGIPHPGDKIQLRRLILTRVSVGPDGTQESLVLLRTNMLLSPKQKIYVGAGKAEDAETGLVLIVHAQEFGSR